MSFGLPIAMLTSLVAAPSSSNGHLYLIAVGNNDVPQTTDQRDLRPLKFADDDAAAMCELFSDLASQTHLLAVLDAETQTQYPALASRARPPTWSQLKRVVSDVATAISHDQQAGIPTEVVFFFSGHGSRKGANPFLALADFGLTQKHLYRDILGRLPAEVVHVIVDACYAEAVVRPRDDRSAAVVDVSESVARSWQRGRTLQRFPHVGAVIATSVSQRAHEWDRYGRGVFTHQVVSALRGAADVNLDRVVEYSELHAFLAAANSQVTNSRAKLEVIVHPPPINLRASLIDLTQHQNAGWATSAGAELDHFFVEEEERGVRVVDSHTEAHHGLRLAVPASTRLALSTPAGDATFSVAPGQEIALDHLNLRPSSLAARGAVNSALERGLFARPFGPRYYRGFVDQTGLPPVSLGPAESVEVRAPPSSNLPEWIAFGGATLLAATAATMGVLAIDARADFRATQVERPAAEARQKYDAYRYTALACGSAALLGAGIGLVLVW